MRAHRRLARLPVRWWCRGTAAVCTLTLVGVWAAAGTSFGGFTASLYNSGSTVTTGTFLWSHSYPNGASGPSSCADRTTSIDDTNQSVICGNSILPTTGSGSATDAITATGTVDTIGVRERFAVTSCGPIQLTDQAGANADPMLARGATTFGQTGPISGGAAVGSDGTSAAAVDVATTSTTGALGTAFSEGIWFKVGNGYTGGGALLAFGDSPSANAAETNYDHALFMSKTGKIVFGNEVVRDLGVVDGSAATAITSAAAYNDGNWHFAAVTESVLNLNVTATLYVDNATPISAIQLSLLSGYTGYWHVGWSTLTRLDATASPYLAGALSNAFVSPLTLSSAQIAALRSAPTQGTWNSLLVTDGAVHNWNLAGSGQTTYAGAEPVIGTSSPCGYVTIAGSATNPTSSFTATPLSTFTSATLNAPSAGTTQNLTITLARNTTYAAAAGYLTGLNIYAPHTIAFTLTGSSAWSSTFAWTGTRTSSTSVGVAFVLA